MRLKNRLSPYPILFNYRNDYIKSSFVSSIEAEYQFNEIDVKVEFNLIDEKLSHLILNGDAAFLVHVECAAVSFRKKYITSEQSLSLKLDAAQLKERIEICTFIITQKDISRYQNVNFHPDYEGMAFDLKKGQLLAIGTAKTYDIQKSGDGLEDLPSIIKIRRLKDSSKGTISVDTDDSDYIYVGLTDDVFDLYTLLGKRSFKETAFSLVLLPALIVVLEQMRLESTDEESLMRSYRWYKAIEFLLEQYGYSVDELDIINSKKSVLAIAQAIFSNPIERSLKELERASWEE